MQAGTWRKEKREKDKENEKCEQEVSIWRG
jgi:hypothetical protein